MIHIHINCARVEKVVFEPQHDMEEDFDFAAWQLIRDLVDKIDRRLRRAAKAVVATEQKLEKG